MKNLKKQILKITAFAVTALFMNFTVAAQDWGTQDTTSQDTTQTETSPQDQNMRIDTTSQDTFQSGSETTPQEQNQRTNESGIFGSMGSDRSVDAQDHDQGISYSEEIEQNELPEEVSSSLQELYPAHEISEAYRGDDDSYKVKVKNQNDEAVVYYSSEGSFERARNLSGLQQDGAFPQQQSQQTREDLNQDIPGQSGEWGTETDTTGTEQGTQGTQDQWGTQEEQDDEGSSYPQEQNQRSEEDMESNERDWGTGTETETETGTQGESGTGTGTQGSESDTTNVNSGSESW